MNAIDLVYQKLPLAAEALGRRDPLLTPKLRAMLILVDGKRSAEELNKLGGADAGELLGQLATLGMVSCTKRAAAATGHTGLSSRPAPLEAGASATDISELRRLAVRRLTDLLGPLADDLCLRIEAAQTPHDLSGVLRQAERTLREMGGAQMAASFTRDLNARGAV